MHPFLKVLSFILLLLLMSMMSYQLLVFVLLVLSLAAIKLQRQHFLYAVKRMRLLFISIFIIYAFGTPGELLPQFPVYFAPTYEGIHLGFLQIAKLLTALAALSVLFAVNTKEELILGLYMLLTPMKWFGLDVKKFSVRLFLTLDYVEGWAVNRPVKFSVKHFDEIFNELGNYNQNRDVYFHKIPFSLLDKTVMVLMLFIILIIIILEWM